MATYYISPDGSDANNGLGPDASHATNKPWLTVGKAMNTGSTVVPGDTIYIAPGTYNSETLIPIVGIASAGSQTSFRGDPLNVQGFKTAAGVRRDAGVVCVTARSVGDTEDAAVSASTNLINPGTNTCRGVKLYNIALEAKHSTGTILRWGTSVTDWLFEDCRMIAGSTVYFGTTEVARAGANLTFRRCEIYTQNMLNYDGASAAATANANMNVLVEECYVFGNLTSTTLALSSSGGNLAGGWTFKACTVVSRNGVSITTVALKVSTVTPITLLGCLFIQSSTWTAGTLGQIIDGGHNRWIGNGPSFTNVTQAGTSIGGVALNIESPSLVKWGLRRATGAWWAWLDTATATQRAAASGIVTSDFLNRQARPWGAGASIGAVQTLAIAKDTASALTGGGANSALLTGAGEIEFFIQAPASAFTLSVRTKSTTYGGASYPRLCVCANPSIGVAADVMVDAADATEQTITTATITPTAQGVLRVRLISRSTTVSSSTWFDIVQSA